MDAQTIDAARGVDLVNLVEKDLGEMGRRSGRWMLFCCPFHDDKNPSLGVTNGDSMKGPFFQCYACGEKGSAIDWVMKYRKVDFKQAIEELNPGRSVGSDRHPQVERKAPAQIFTQPPGEKWQKRASLIIDRAQEWLWSETGVDKEIIWRETDPETGAKIDKRMAPIDYLFSRGLTEETLRIWKIGYIPRTWRDKPAHWGLTGKDITIFQGILIPCLVNDLAWYLKIRVPVPIERTKYPQITGSKKALYMVQTLEWNETVVFTEGEFDALLLWQEVEDIAGVVTLGGAGGELNAADWGLYLLHTKSRLIAYDLDDAGEKGAAGLAWLGNSRRVNVPRLRPHDKDITDFYRSGGDLRAWLQSELEAGQ